jgi:transposase/IS5 family transposase
MPDPSLFGPAPDLPAATPATDNSTSPGKPRLRPVERCQVEMRCASLDQLLPPDHPARSVWDYVEKLDLSPLLQSIQAVAGKAGRDANDPRVLLALWLFATIQGVGSARELDRLCQEHLAYQWLCGGMSVNYHSLADFRTHQVAFLDRLLTDSVGTLLHQGVIDLQRVAQDGMKVRASAGAGSFRRQKTLQHCLQEAEQQVQVLRSQVDEDSGAASRRQEAARQRAAEERRARVQQALEERQKLVEVREQQKKEKGVRFDPEELRTSTTDPEARRMKMADGGTRPGYNVQLCTATESGVIVGVAVTNSGADCGQLAPMIDQLQDRYGETPKEALVDGGFTTLSDIESVHEKHDVDVYAPIKEEEKKKAAGIDPYQPGKKDGPGVAAWRQRMGTAAARTIYPLRASTAEWVNAGARNRGLYQVRVRGLRKVLAVVLLQALAHNLLRAEALQAMRGESGTAKAEGKG